MFQLEVVDKINLLIMICFSLLILTFTLLLLRGKSPVKLLCLAFLTPLILGLASYLSNHPDIPRTLNVSGQFLMVFLLLISVLKPKAKQYNFFLMCVILFPLVLLVIQWKLDKIFELSMLPICRVALAVVFFLLDLILLSRKTGPTKYLSQGILLWVVGNVLLVTGGKPAFVYASIAANIAAYFILFVYFYKETYQALMVKVYEAEKKLNHLDKTLDLEVKKRTFEIERANERLLSVSKTDTLTKAYNKGAILYEIERLISAKPKSEFCILMFDIDNFKVINDTLGHIEGDKCIKKLANIANSCIRTIDKLGRYGGDEFLILLPDATISQARLIAERFRKKTEETENPHFTVSIGLAAYPTDAATVKGLIGIADDGLYQSKRKGRNAVSHRNLY